MFTEANRRLLDGPVLAVLATLGPAGAPHTAPMWYLRDGDSLLMVTGRRSQKARNLERDARASITVDRRQRPYHALMIDCVGLIDAEVDPDELRGRLARRYMTADEAEHFVKRRRGADSVALRFTPTRVSEYGG